jgi:hypothetical protein
VLCGSGVATGRKCRGRRRRQAPAQPTAFSCFCVEPCYEAIKPNFLRLTQAQKQVRNALAASLADQIVIDGTTYKAAREEEEEEEEGDDTVASTCTPPAAMPGLVYVRL